MRFRIWLVKPHPLNPSIWCMETTEGQELRETIDGSLRIMSIVSSDDGPDTAVILRTLAPGTWWSWEQIP